MMELIPVSEIDGEPRIRDIDLAERLGFDRPRKIREIIERNMAEIEGFGHAPHRGAHIEIAKPTGGIERREVQEYWLNEEQALLVSVLSNAPKAPAVRAMLIRTFVAWRKQALPSQPQVDVAMLLPLLTQLVSQQVRRDLAEEQDQREQEEPAEVIGPAFVQDAWRKEGFRRILHVVCMKYNGDATRSQIQLCVRNRYRGYELDWLMNAMIDAGYLRKKVTKRPFGAGRPGITYVPGPRVAMPGL